MSTNRIAKAATVSALIASLWLASIASAEEPAPAVLVGAGDIATCNAFKDRAGAMVAAGTDEQTADLVAAIPDASVFTLGDNVFLKGTAANFAACYTPSWGAFRDRTRPVIGNHEYLGTYKARPYFAYFGAAAGTPGQGWYVYELNGWRIYALNSQANVKADSAQYAWLSAELEANPRACTIAMWHQPLRSSAIEFGSNRPQDHPRMLALEALLYDHGNDLILNSVHAYERLAPHAPDGSPDPLGQRVITAGTGGRITYSPDYWKASPLATSEVRIAKRAGVLRLDLAAGSYTWQFIGLSGAVLDAGSSDCTPIDQEVTP